MMETEPLKSDNQYRVRSTVDASALKPGQVRTIVETVLELGQPTTTQLVDALSAKLKSRQSPRRVFDFYRKAMIEAGLLDELELTTPKDAVKPASKTAKVPAKPATIRPPVSRPVVQIVLGDEIIKKAVIRAFFNQDAVITAICGTEADDHEVWMIDGLKAILVGTLTAKDLKEAVRAKALALSADKFEWLNTELESLNLKALGGSLFKGENLRKWAIEARQVILEGVASTAVDADSKP